MEAIILAGGFGTRLRDVVPDLPKVMAPISGRPFLEILLTELARRGFKHTILSLGYKADLIIAYFGNGFKGMEITYQVEDAPLGTGGAIRMAMECCKSDHVYVFNGDTYLEIEVNEIETQWRFDKFPIIVAREVSDTSRFGRLETDGKKVTKFNEKGISGRGLINAGCYVFPSGILNEFPKNHIFSIENDFLANIVKISTIRFFVTTGRFIDIGVPEDYKRAQQELSFFID